MFKRIAQLFGYELIRKSKLPILESHLQRVIAHYRPTLIVDVGANTGQFGHLVRTLGFAGKILSFEPVTATYDTLQATVASDPDWTALKIALGDHPHEATINVFDKSDFSSILAPSDFGKKHYNHMATARQETITIDTLDKVLAERGLDQERIFLKMDTQGFDLQVFRGARQSLGQVVGILSEISFAPIYDNMPDYHQALAEYEAAGFSVSGLFPISRRRDGGLIEMDCVLVNKACGVTGFPK